MRDLLRWQFDLTWSLFEYHLDRLTPADFLWEPTDNVWTVRNSVPDWADRRVDVMRRGLAAKYTLDSEPGAVLLGTGHAALVEGNDRDDRFWGVCAGEGRSVLGILLTERRGVLRHLREAGSSA